MPRVTGFCPLHLDDLGGDALPALASPQKMDGLAVMIILIRYNYPVAGAAPARIYSFLETAAPYRWLFWPDVERDKWALNAALLHRDRTIGGPRPARFEFDYDVDPYSSTLDNSSEQTEHR